MIVGGLAGRPAGRPLVCGGLGRGVAERDDQLNVREEAGRDLAPDNHVGDR